MCELPPSTDSDESIEALTSNLRQFLPEKSEQSFNFPNAAAKLEQGGKMRGLDLESRNLEGWEWWWNVVGPWKVVLGHASIFSFLLKLVVMVVVEMKWRKCRYPNSAIW